MLDPFRLANGGAKHERLREFHRFIYQRLPSSPGFIGAPSIGHGWDDRSSRVFGCTRARLNCSTFLIVTDPNWLYSTEAQAAAALVAIIGGFLVSRLVSLSAERQGLQQRLDQIKDHGGRLKAERQSLYQQALDEGQADFYKEAAPIWAANRCNVPEELVPKRPDQLPLSIFNDWKLNLGTTISRLFDRVSDAVQPNEISINTAQAKQRVPGLEAVPPEYLTPVCKAISKELRRGFEDTPVGRAASMTDRIEESYSLGPIGSSYFNTRMISVGTLDNQINARQAEADLVSGHLKQLVSPTGVGTGIVALAIFAGLGIVFPLILIAVRPVPDGPVIRILTIVAFAVGLTGVLWFIFWQWRDLRVREEVPG
jgi:hypothetical protein